MGSCFGFGGENVGVTWRTAAAGPKYLAGWLGGLLEKGFQRSHSSKAESENGFAGIVVSLETSPEILLILPKKYTWIYPVIFPGFPGLFPGFLWA